MGRSTGTVTGQEIKKWKGSPTELRILSVQLLGDNPEEVQFINVSGEDTAPLIGDEVVVFEIAHNYKVTLGTRDKIIASVSGGEKKTYSRDSAGNIVASFYLKDDGTSEIEAVKISIGDGTNELVDLFDQFLTEVKSLVSASLLAGNVDAPGAASTGTLSLILGGLASMEATIGVIQAKLGTFKV